MSALFVSDLHLHPSRPAAVHRFLRLLQLQRGRAGALYILGDLFDTWVGDDDPEPVYAAVRAALRRCVASGTPVYLMRGNRDFLLGERFAHQSGCSLIDDPTRADLYGIPTLLMHGDTLCTDDLDYQALRRRLRDRQWQRQVLALPLAERRALAQRARESSRMSIQSKQPANMQVNDSEVLRVIEEHGVDLLIHGHTHRAGEQPVRRGSRQATRIDLGHWYRAGTGLVVDSDGWRWLELTESSDESQR